MRKIDKPGYPPTEPLYKSDADPDLVLVNVAAEQMKAELTQWQRAHGHPMEAAEVRKRYFDRLDKARTRKLLHEEQSGRCAFCEGIVSDDAPSAADRKDSGMRIAHWTPIGVDAKRALDWKNLFGSCERNAPAAHCDVFQENGAPPANAPTPAEHDWGTWMVFRVDGSFAPASHLTPERKDWVANVLALFNLNADRLKTARLNAIEGLQHRLDPAKRAKPERPYDLGTMDEELERLRRGGTHTGYPTAQRLWLEQRRRRG